MVQMLIDVTFLGVILIPIFIFFLALYQNLLEIPRAQQKIRRRRAKVQPYYVDTGEILYEELKVVK